MIESATLEALTDALSGFDFSEQSQTNLRNQFQPLRLTFCLEDEMGITVPYRECGPFNLYLVYSGGHCMSLTHDLDSASEVLVAEVEE